MCLDLEGTWGNWLNISLLLNSIFSCHVFHNLHEAAKLKQKVVLVIFGTWEVWRINQLELLNFVAFDILIHQRCYWDIQRYLMVVSSGAYYFYPSVRPLLSSRCHRQKFDGITHVPVDSLEQVSKSWIPFTTEICGRLRTCAVRCYLFPFLTEYKRIPKLRGLFISTLHFVKLLLNLKSLHSISHYTQY